MPGKLTFLLRDSLGGNSKTIIAACISPSVQDSVFTATQPCLQTFFCVMYASRPSPSAFPRLCALVRRCPPWNLQPVQSTFAAQFWSQFRKYEIVSNCDIVCFTRICPVFVWGLPITVFESRKEICGPAIWGSDEWGIFRHGGISHAGGKAVSTLASTQMLMSLNVNLVSTVCYTSFWLSRVHEGEKPADSNWTCFQVPILSFSNFSSWCDCEKESASSNA